ncbi:LacI family DNA-binding transcriptional regulator [Micromonospora sp. M12]
MPDHTRPPDKRVTIYDVAVQADVSPSTVSAPSPDRAGSTRRPPSGSGRSPNGWATGPTLARALTTSRTQMIALVIADITNPVYAEIVRGAQEAATDGEYTTVLIDAQESDRFERVAIERTMSTVDGIVLASSRMSDSSIRMFAKQRPVVVLNRAIADVPCVVTDNPVGASGRRAPR